MKVDVQTIDSVTKKLEVIIPADDIKKIEDGIYNELKKQAKIKGFRPGKAPRNIIAALYKDYIEDELKSRLLKNTMFNALKEADINPLGEPIVNFLEEDGLKGYVLECEVIPEIELPQYKGIEVETEPINITEEEINKRIENIRLLHAEMRMREENEGAESGDFVVISYQGFLSGVPLKDVKSDAYPIELGASSVMPEFEKEIFGLKIGEDKEFTIDFPEDYPDKDICGKSVLFKVHVKEVRKKILPELDDDFAKDMGFDNLDAMKANIKNELFKEKEKNRNKIIYQKIVDKILEGIDIPVPKRYLEKRVESMIEDAEARYPSEGIAEDVKKNIESTLRKDFEEKAVLRIKKDILLTKIAEKEEIKIEDGDVDERIKRIAEDSKRPFIDIKNFYERNNLIDSLKDIILEEKTLNLLKDNAIIRETP
ncbi:MAG: trigger factor [Syntrophorhabdaceae bacterium]|nr:trigger factor [Syntrophorhabdaceae bacterium]